MHNRTESFMLVPRPQTIRASAAICFAATLVLSACASETVPERQGTPAVDTTGMQTKEPLVEAERQTVLAVRADSALADDALRLRVAELQRIADTATAGAVAAPALLRLGLLKMRLYTGDVRDSIAKLRPGDFFYDEVSGSHLYGGGELTTLLERFPDSPLADEAAYAITLLPAGGECEGYINCYVSRVSYRSLEFLEQHPRSPLAGLAVARINDGVHDVLRDTPDLAAATEMYDPKEFRPQLARYDSIARTLPAAPSAEALFVIAGLWERLGEAARAKDIYARLETAPGLVPLDSIRNRAARVKSPTR
jgi:hypothetical protein